MIKTFIEVGADIVIVSVALAIGISVVLATLMFFFGKEGK